MLSSLQHSDLTTDQMVCFICATCGTQYEASSEPPAECRVCVDDRQHVGRNGQAWTTHDELAASLHVRIETDNDLIGIGIAESFGIPQRALLVPSSDAGNVLWDCISVVTPDAVEQLQALGGVDLIAISHPHFYSSMVEWSDALGGVPILVHDADRQWIFRYSDKIIHWSGDHHPISPTLKLLHLPGHFPGSAALLWSDGPGGKRIMLSGDSLHVAADRRHISVMHSVPNYIPVGSTTIRDIQERLVGIDFDDLYGFTWDLNIIGGAREAVAGSLDRYLAAIM